jgi:hypothetical protein
MKIIGLRNKDSFGLRVGIFSFWMGFSIDANAPIRPLIRDIPVDKMSGLRFSVVLRHKRLFQVQKWVKQCYSLSESKTPSDQK